MNSQAALDPAYGLSEVVEEPRARKATPPETFAPWRENHPRPSPMDGDGVHLDFEKKVVAADVGVGEGEGEPGDAALRAVVIV